MQTWKMVALYLTVLTYLWVVATAYNEEYQKFLRQHHDYPRIQIEDTEYCQMLISNENRLRSCKPYNVFIHAPEAQLRDVCGRGGYPFRNTKKRRSRKFFPVTICRLQMMTRARQCVYYTTFGTTQVVVSCDEDKLPVQLDEVLTMAPPR